MKEFYRTLDTQSKSDFQTVRFWKAVNFPTAVSLESFGGTFLALRGLPVRTKHMQDQNGQLSLIKAEEKKMGTNPSSYFTCWLLLVFGSILYKGFLGYKKKKHEPRTKHQG